MPLTFPYQGSILPALTAGKHKTCSYCKHHEFFCPFKLSRGRLHTIKKREREWKTFILHKAITTAVSKNTIYYMERVKRKECAKQFRG